MDLVPEALMVISGPISIPTTIGSIVTSISCWETRTSGWRLPFSELFPFPLESRNSGCKMRTPGGPVVVEVEVVEEVLKKKEKSFKKRFSKNNYKAVLT